MVDKFPTYIWFQYLSKVRVVPKHFAIIFPDLELIACKWYKKNDNCLSVDFCVQWIERLFTWFSWMKWKKRWANWLCAINSIMVIDSIDSYSILLYLKQYQTFNWFLCVIVNNILSMQVATDFLANGFDNNYDTKKDVDTYMVSTALGPDDGRHIFTYLNVLLTYIVPHNLPIGMHYPRHFMLPCPLKLPYQLTTTHSIVNCSSIRIF